MDEYKLMTPEQAARLVGIPTAEELGKLPEHWQRAVLTVLDDFRQQLLKTRYRRRPLPLRQEEQK